MAVMGSAHHRCEEQGDMEHTGNARLRPVTFNSVRDLKSTWLSYGLCNLPYRGEFYQSFLMMFQQSRRYEADTKC